MRDFDDRVAVITGAGGGIGGALAEALAARGCDLALVDVDAAGLRRVAAAVQAAGRRATTHVVDVSSRAQMEALAREVEQAHGRVDVLVNNAGVTVAATFREHRLEDFEWVLGVNLWGIVYGCKLFLPLLEQRDQAYVVNVSSLLGLVGTARHASYCTSKFGVVGLSKVLGLELAGSPVRVLTVHPGAVRTGIAATARYSGSDAAQFRDKAMKILARGMPPRAVAEKIVAAMARNAERLLISPETRLGDALGRLWPALPSRWLAWLQARLT